MINLNITGVDGDLNSVMIALFWIVTGLYDERSNCRSAFLIRLNEEALSETNMLFTGPPFGIAAGAKE